MGIGLSVACCACLLEPCFARFVVYRTASRGGFVVLRRHCGSCVRLRGELRMTMARKVELGYGLVLVRHAMIAVLSDWRVRTTMF